MISENEDELARLFNSQRRKTLGCLATWTGAAVIWSLVGGVPHALGVTSSGSLGAASKQAFTFAQISDTHIGFHKEANPDVVRQLPVHGYGSRRSLLAYLRQ